MNRQMLTERLDAAAEWLIQTAMNHSDEPIGAYGRKMATTYWRGAVKGEYLVRRHQWDSFCPVWHTGQAVKALMDGIRVLDRRSWLPAAEEGLQFILRNQLASGMILAYEDYPDKVNTSAVLECLDGLFAFPQAEQHAIRALYFLKDRLWDSETGRFHGLYDPVDDQVMPDDLPAAASRPLLDDAVYLTGWKLTGEKAFMEIAVKTADRLLQDEYPAGNWLNYGPCIRELNRFHPRQAYWWGRPMLALHKATGDKRYLDCFLRAVSWYRQAMRHDGGIFRGTYGDFSSDSFGHCSSGTACGVLMFLDCYRETGDKDMIPYIELGLEFCMSMQFIQPEDRNLKGAVLEKVLPPDGTDQSPYQVRDLGTIFFMQAALKYLEIFS